MYILYMLFWDRDELSHFVYELIYCPYSTNDLDMCSNI